MSKHQRFLEKLKSSPPPSDIKWKDLKSFLLHLGYTDIKKGSGSRRKFFHREKRAIFLCHQPHAPECVDKGCIVDLVEHLKINGLI